MPATTMLTAKTAVHSLFTTALAAETAVVVSWGLPDWEPDDMVVVQGATGGWSMGAMGSSRPRDERMVITATVSVWRGGADQRAATTRCVALFDLLEAAVRADPTLGGVVQSATMTGFDLEEAPTVDNGQVTGRVCEIACRVDIRARI